MLDPDLDEYLTEYRLQAPVEPVSHYEGKTYNFIFFCSTVIYYIKKSKTYI